jgi:hypothetical protein
MRPITLAALVVATGLGIAPPALARPRVAIVEVDVEGSAPTALGNQLQDGFVAGLGRSGVQVVDPGDAARKIEGRAELQRCDSSPCLKSLGQLLEAPYIVKLKIDVAGNSYKSVARLFSTEGSAPAVLPIATESKTCEVCTVEEARATMARLAEALRPHIDEPPPPPPPPPPVAIPPPPRLLGPVVAAMAGALAAAAGIAVLTSNGDCSGGSCSGNHARNVAGGVLIGAGAAFAVAGSYVTVARSRGGEPVTAVTVAWRW